MKIAYVVDGNPYDKHSWSGTNYYVRRSLENQGNNVYCIYGFKPKYTIVSLAKKVIAKLIGKDYKQKRCKQTSSQWAKYIKKNLQKDTDAIFSLGTVQVACLETRIPIFIYVDGIFEQMRIFYGYGNLSQKSIKDANEIEQLALEKCCKIISCSIETGECIKDNYKTHTGSLEIVPLGANLDIKPNSSEVFTAIEKRDTDVCHLLFVGVTWQRKGADIVLETTRILHDRGFKVVLHICGLREIPVELPNYVVNHGFLRKSNEEEFEVLKSLYLSSHFLFVPSRAEAYGLVFCEASAFGLPSISHKVGGLTTIVEDGQNGKLFELGTSPDVFADYIEKTFRNKDGYRELCKNSYKRYENLLNWDVAGKKLTELIEQNHWCHDVDLIDNGRQLPVV